MIVSSKRKIAENLRVFESTDPDEWDELYEYLVNPKYS